MVGYCWFDLYAVMFTPCVMLFSACVIADLRKSEKEDSL